MAEILLYGAVTSAIYAMLAVGFTLIFGVARILNLAHGSFYALGAYSAYVLTTVLHVPLVLGGGAGRADRGGASAWSSSACWCVRCAAPRLPC